MAQVRGDEPGEGGEPGEGCKRGKPLYVSHYFVLVLILVLPLLPSSLWEGRSNG